MLEMFILHHCLLNLQYGHTLWNDCCALYGVYPYIHVLDRFIFALFVVVLGQPVCNKYFWPRFVQNLDPILINV